MLKRFLALLLVLVLVLSGCSARDGKSESDPSSSEPTGEPQGDASVGPVVELVLREGEPVSEITPELADAIGEKHKINKDALGWLQIPGTPIDDVVLQRAGDLYNEYYLRLNIKGGYDFYGVYYADSRAEISGATRDDLGVNTCIYGHAIADEKSDSRYDIRFGPMHDFRDPDFAKKHPYIFFSTAEEDMVFEVIAVFVANADNPNVPYNSNPSSGAEFVSMVKKQILPRSKYSYDVELDENDKFLTLSTCIYTLDNGKVTGYPDTMYRYAVMARLMDPDEPMKAAAAFTLNDNPIIDKDGQWAA